MIPKNVLIFLVLSSYTLLAQEEGLSFSQKVRRYINAKVAAFEQKSRPEQLWHTANFVIPIFVMAQKGLTNLSAMVMADDLLKEEFKEKPTPPLLKPMKKIFNKLGVTGDESQKKVVNEILSKMELDPAKVNVYFARKEHKNAMKSAGAAICNNLIVSARIRKPFTAWGKVKEVAEIKKTIDEPHDMDEFKFLIAHEAGHIKSNHSRRTVSFLFLSPWLSRAILYTYNVALQKLLDHIVEKIGMNKEDKSYKAIALLKKANEAVSECFLTQILLAYNLYYWYSRRLEKEADLLAAQAVGAKGGIAYFSRISAAVQPTQFSRRVLGEQTTDRSGEKDEYNDTYQDPEHPPLIDRVLYLTAFKEAPLRS